MKGTPSLPKPPPLDTAKGPRESPSGTHIGPKKYHVCCAERVFRQLLHPQTGCTNTWVSQMPKTWNHVLRGWTSNTHHCVMGALTAKQQLLLGCRALQRRLAQAAQESPWLHNCLCVATGTRYMCLAAGCCLGCHGNPAWLSKCLGITQHKVLGLTTASELQNMDRTLALGCRWLPSKLPWLHWKPSLAQPIPQRLRTGTRSCGCSCR